ncbi:GcrA family cell cycle regulator [Hoeflea poritis]|uniref:GcrA cell cycle regulator n=1 Tax=Hoeflea poritis TaxID=2993659 RepID=A0ABT4VMI3_9HYPH|nr:GcrA family cell cycle regulator [Hoeflea poritis]MDA4845928.1 hypothetical protein [Hoeflea poritis]
MEVQNWDENRISRAVELLDAEGRSVPEIADELEITIAEVRRQITIGRSSHATRRVRQRLAETPSQIPHISSFPKPEHTIKLNAMAGPKNKNEDAVLESKPATFLELISNRERRCLWPLDNKVGADMMCCGASVQEPDADRLHGAGNGGSYCAYHRKKAAGTGTHSERAALDGFVKRS